MPLPVTDFGEEKGKTSPVIEFYHKFPADLFKYPAHIGIEFRPDFCECPIHFSSLHVTPIRINESEPEYFGISFAFI